MDDIPLSPDQEQLAHDLLQRLEPLFQQEARRLARLLASKPDDQILGRTEFQLRERVHQLAADTLQRALEGRKKGATTGPA